MKKRFLIDITFDNSEDNTESLSQDIKNAISQFPHWHREDEITVNSVYELTNNFKTFEQVNKIKPEYFQNKEQFLKDHTK